MHILICMHKMCICYIHLKYLFCIEFVIGFFCLFKLLIKFWHSRFLFSGVQGWVLKNARRLQNAFLGRNKRRKTTLQKQTASMTCVCLPPRVPGKHNAYICGRAMSGISQSSDQDVCIHIATHVVRVSVDVMVTIMTRADLDVCYVRSLMGQAWRDVFWYAECVIAGLSDVERWHCLVTGSGEQGRALPSLSLFAGLKEVIPHTLQYKRLQMRTVWKSKIETRAFPFLFFVYGYIPCIAICFLSEISITCLCLMYFCSERINPNLLNFH